GQPTSRTAGQPAAALGVSRATLYAYASRGQLRSEPAPGRPKECRYHRQDLDRLQERKEARRDPAKVAARGLHWGGPVLESGITLIQNGRLYYRGQDAVALARSASLEQVAALLWGVADTDRERLFAQPSALSLQQIARVRSLESDAFARLQITLAIAARADLAAHDLRPAAVPQTGARILRLLATTIEPRGARLPVHRALQAAWAPKRAEVA